MRVSFKSKLYREGTKFAAIFELKCCFDTVTYDASVELANKLRRVRAGYGVPQQFTCLQPDSVQIVISMQKMRIRTV